MKIISFNTFLAPTMCDRYRRSKIVANIINEYLIHDIEVIGLQELNSMTIGPLGWLWLIIFQLQLVVSTHVQSIMDFIFILEGYLFPMTQHHIVTPILTVIDKYNEGVPHMNQYTLIMPLHTTRGISSGVATIARVKNIKHSYHVDLPTDCVHKPGAVSIVGRFGLIINVHFIPHLSNPNWRTWIVNRINEQCGYNVNELSVENMDCIRDYIKTWQGNIIVMGDFNISKHSYLYGLLLDRFSLHPIIDTSTISYETHFQVDEKNMPMRGQTLQHIDYIFTNAVVRSSCLPRYVAPGVSDHHPIMVSLVTPPVPI